ncbi:hypothetical protein XCV4293 [Xanthomonas euvesicatoria pv. vesicatoria str. 85-10]|uniref:Uncharacterized protein n=1 Tax=Xanthomonas euvesicatoria pv. vesicatoria (strain 85-10) TaxID=316273 RepID=Q3BMI9_XANE5|nr:hypothetical protein XCV4293 [Xanthomonas euvesicatoria pv. vesicatoria str. 85-10]
MSSDVAQRQRWSLRSRAHRRCRRRIRAGRLCGVGASACALRPAGLRKTLVACTAPRLAGHWHRRLRKPARADWGHICGWCAATGAAPVAHSHMPARLSHTATIAALGETMAAQDVTCAGLRSVYRAAGLAGGLDVSANTTYCLSTLNRTMYPKHFVARWRLA